MLHVLGLYTLRSVASNPSLPITCLSKLSHRVAQNKLNDIMYKQNLIKAWVAHEIRINSIGNIVIVIESNLSKNHSRPLVDIAHSL